MKIVWPGIGAKVAGRTGQADPRVLDPIIRPSVRHDKAAAVAADACRHYHKPMTTITRFAPSPTGLIHLGNVRTALFSWLAAHRGQGRFILRIEDTDAERSRPEYVAALMADLRWLGLHWEEGPEAGGPHGPYHQSERGAVYARYYHELEAQAFAYPCFCSPEELELSRKLQLSQGRAPRYAGACRRLSAAERAARLEAGHQPTLRFRVPEGQTVEFTDVVRGPQRFQSDDIGDFIIRRADGTPAFFFCNAIDDALMEVSLVLRGEDHLTNTPRQILLLQALGLPVPGYGHMALIVGDDGQPLSKRNGSRNVAELREAGYFPEAVDNYLARLGHSIDSDALLDLAGLAARFDAAHLGRSPARFDPQQLDHWQRQALLTLPWERIWAWLADYLATPVPESRRESFVAAVRANLNGPEEAELWAAACFGDAPLEPGAHAVIAGAPEALWPAALAALDTHGTDFKALAAQAGQAAGLKGKQLFMPLRAALTGQTHGPELAQLLPLIGPERARARLQRIANLES